MPQSGESRSENVTTAWVIAMASGAVDYLLPIDAIGPALDDIVHGRRHGPVIT
jgi:hypothetical protein